MTLLEKTLRTLDEIIQVGLKFKFNWYRGHSQIFEDLIPFVFRKDFYNGHHDPSRKPNELQIIEEFKRLAPSLTDTPLSTSGNLDWLILMQQHGTPTRLLDWTESILVSAFFAVIEDPDSDAQIWRLHPQTLNERSIGIADISVMDRNKYLQYLAEEPLFEDHEVLMRKMDLSESVKFPIAFSPVLAFTRISAQGSVFTIHPKPQSGNSLIDIFKDSPEHLSKYIIPAKSKEQIISDLFSLGIHHRTLFPNLDSLSKDIIIKYRRR